LFTIAMPGSYTPQHYSVDGNVKTTVSMHSDAFASYVKHSKSELHISENVSLPSPRNSVAVGVCALLLRQAQSS